MPPTRSSTCTHARTAAMLAQAVNDDASSQSPKRKRCTKAEIAEDARRTAKEKDAAQEAEHAVNQQLASLEAARSCDTDIPTPHPPASSRLGSSVTLKSSSSQVDITHLVAEQRHTRSAAGEESAPAPACTAAPAHAAAPACVNAPGTCSREEDCSDEEDESPVKKKQMVILPDPVTPVAQPQQRLTVVQKQEVAKAKAAAKASENAAKEEAKAMRAAERKVKAKAKEDARQQKVAVRLEKVHAKEAAKEKKERVREEARENRAAEKMKAWKGNDSQKTPMNDPTTSTTADAEGYDAGTNEMGRGLKGEKPVSAWYIP